MNPKEKRAAALAAAQKIVDGAKAAVRDLTSDESAQVEAHLAEVKSCDEQIAAAAKSSDLMARIAATGTPDDAKGDERPVGSLGEHFVKSVGAEGFARLKERGGYSVASPEFKAATDVQSTPGVFQVPLLTEVDRTIVKPYRRPSVADVLGTGTLGSNSNAISYFIEGSVEGSFTTVAEGGQKPQLHVGDPTQKTDALKKIAAFWDTSDEMAEDVDFWVSEVNNRALYLLSMAEEAQLLNGDGTGSNVQGLFNRSGIQTEEQAATADSSQDAIFRAMTKVQTATGLAADAVLINPADYQTLRLNKDGNGQYFGGGYFSGEYGNGGVALQPAVWGLTTIVTAAVPAKTVAVGAFKAAATVYRKGGVRVESTNSDAGKFTKNVITTRVEERIALAVRVPAAVVKVTLK